MVFIAFIKVIEVCLGILDCFEILTV